MKKMLKAILDWMERKWPDVVVITQKEFDELKNELKKQNEILSVYSPERLKAIEAEINKFNVSLGFGAVANSQRQPFQR